MKQKKFKLVKNKTQKYISTGGQNVSIEPSTMYSLYYGNKLHILDIRDNVFDSKVFGNALVEILNRERKIKLLDDLE